MIDTEMVGSKLWLIHLYQEQLDKFNKLGLGSQTENGVVVTKALIETTQKRLSQLTIIYDKHKSFRVYTLRKAMKKRMDKEKLLNGKTNGNGTTAAQSCEDNSNTRHENNES
jgi:hypothetical protein|tara:strand:+ start:269 stop:604 length:336 start_codon:yes stop_codon:yes gene_type:complete